MAIELSANAMLLTVALGALLWMALSWLRGGGGNDGYPKGANVSVGLRRDSNALDADATARAGPGKAARAITIKWADYEVERVTPAGNDDAVALRIKLPSPDDTAGLPIGRHISVRATIDGQVVVRPYTPVSLPWQRGHFDLLLKVYELGAMSSYLASRQAGDTISVRGPIGNFKYQANTYGCIVLLGAGSGLTPLVQLMRCVLAEASDRTRLVLLYQNRTERDILMREVLDAMAAKHGAGAGGGGGSGRRGGAARRRGGAGAGDGDGSSAGAGEGVADGGASDPRVTVHYCLSRAGADWSDPEAVPGRHSGYVTDALLREAVAGVPASQLAACICGPSGFNKFALGLLSEGGVVPPDEITVF